MNSKIGYYVSAVALLGLSVCAAGAGSIIGCICFVACAAVVGLIWPEL